MMQVKTNRLNKQSLITGFVLWALIVLISLPVGRCMEVESTNGPASKILLTVLNEILDNPFHYFMFLPRTLKGWSYGAYALCFGGLVPLICYNSYMEKRDLMPEKENGSAKWNDSLKDYNKQYISVPRLGSESPNMIMTKDILLSMDTRKTMRNNNVLVIGGTGTGKSRFLIMPNLMQANASFVVTDPSGEILENMGSFLESEGYTIKVLNLVDMRCSDSYNPFKYADGEEGILSMITALIANTTPKGSKSNDPFWEKAETARVQALGFYIRAEFPVQEQNFSSVMYLLRQADAPEGKKNLLWILCLNVLRKRIPTILQRRAMQYIGRQEEVKLPRVLSSLRRPVFRLSIWQPLIELPMRIQLILSPSVKRKRLCFVLPRWGTRLLISWWVCCILSYFIRFTITQKLNVRGNDCRFRCVSFWMSLPTSD